MIVVCLVVMCSWCARVSRGEFMLVVCTRVLVLVLVTCACGVYSWRVLAYGVLVACPGGVVYCMCEYV